jgi:phosphonoacetate hydrolase
MRKDLIFCVDGFGPEYLAASDMPSLKKMARAGALATVNAVVPTVTNVNNVSMVTMALPAIHGITGNYYLDSFNGTEHYMESHELIRIQTVFEEFNKQGLRTFLLTAKDKLRALIGNGTTMAISAERPEAWIVDQIGPPPGIYSTEVNLWLMKALINTLQREGPFDLVYLATTDYPMHTFSPEDEQAQKFLYEFDSLLGTCIDLNGDGGRVVVTADHGMNPKHHAIDPQRVLASSGIKSIAIPIIKDRYVVHHSNLGGAAYIYVEDHDAINDARSQLGELQGVEEALHAEEAARRFELDPGRIGDLMILGRVDTVFGTLHEAREEVAIRSHGSLHEQAIPLIAYGPGAGSFLFERNLDALRWVVNDR